MRSRGSYTSLLAHIEANVPAALDVHLVLDNYATHKHPKVRAWLATRPRTGSLQAEYRRKIRTMARGIQTLWFKRHLLNPFRYGAFAWMLFSHKLCRWLVYPALPLAAVALVAHSLRSPLWLTVLVLALAGTALGVVGMRWPQGRPRPKLLNLAGFALASNVAGMLAWWQVVQNKREAVWEPTRRS